MAGRALRGQARSRPVAALCDSRPCNTDGDSAASVGYIPLVCHRAQTPGARARMTRLSVNVNKIATLRNSRNPPGGEVSGVPSVTRAVQTVLDAGARGITVHPRTDQRHITAQDVRDIAEILKPLKGEVELNLEGDPRPDLIELAHAVQPDQLTLVPVREGEVTSQAGWPADTPREDLEWIIADAQSTGMRVALFVDPQPEPIRWAAALGADRVELFTEPYAQAFAKGDDEASIVMGEYVAAAEAAHAEGLGVNAGHDLDLNNLTRFATLPYLAEVSIGHALVAEAVFGGLQSVVTRYLKILTEYRRPRVTGEQPRLP